MEKHYYLYLNLLIKVDYEYIPTFKMEMAAATGRLSAWSKTFIDTVNGKYIIEVQLKLQKNNKEESHFQVRHGRNRLPSGPNGRGHPRPAGLPGERKLYNKMQKTLFNASSRLTDHFPRSGSRILELTVRPLASNPLLSALFTHHNRRVVRGLKSFRSFLVVPDIHIGDAVMSQSALTALRDFFYEARVDYVVNRTAYPLIEGNPEATHVLPFFSNGSFPSSADLLDLRGMIQRGGYDLVLNFCPYINEKDMGLNGDRMLNFLTYAPTIVRN